MADYRLSTPGIKVNDETIAIVANSYKSVGGFGEDTVSAASTGGDGVEIVVGKNAESKIGKMMFDVMTTPDNMKKLAAWKSNPGGNTVASIATFANGSSFSESMESATLVTDPERNQSSDGTISIEFHGSPIITA